MENFEKIGTIDLNNLHNFAIKIAENGDLLLVKFQPTLVENQQKALSSKITKQPIIKQDYQKYINLLKDNPSILRNWLNLYNSPGDFEDICQDLAIADVSYESLRGETQKDKMRYLAKHLAAKEGRLQKLIKYLTSKKDPEEWKYLCDLIQQQCELNL
ncbi:hypothetical protein GTQ43_39045 [Nostoc sp. KVJ3]|nr:hypothetical protein [Nostoc sp. KVJ3]